MVVTAAHHSKYYMSLIGIFILGVFCIYIYVCSKYMYGKYMEKEMKTHSRILAWKIPQTESLEGYHPWGCRELDSTEQLNNNSKTYTYII